jgi:hypothetical protein
MPDTKKSEVHPKLKANVNVCVNLLYTEQWDVCASSAAYEEWRCLHTRATQVNKGRTCGVCVWGGGEGAILFS